MSLRDIVLEYIEDAYPDSNISEEIEEKIEELQQLIFDLEESDTDEEDEDGLIEYHPDMDDFTSQEE